MNEKVMTTTTNADGLVVICIADTFVALTAAVAVKKTDRKKGFNGA